MPECLFTLACRIDTTARLEALRKELRFQNVDAFLIPSGDSHQENAPTLLHGLLALSIWRIFHEFHNLTNIF